MDVMEVVIKYVIDFFSGDDDMVVFGDEMVVLVIGVVLVIEKF